MFQCVYEEVSCFTENTDWLKELFLSGRIRSPLFHRSSLSTTLRVLFDEFTKWGRSHIMKNFKNKTHIGEFSDVIPAQETVFS